MSVLDDLQSKKREIEGQINSLVSRENSARETKERKEKEKQAIAKKREADLAMVNAPQEYIKLLIGLDYDQIDYDLLKNLFFLTLHLLTRGESKIDTREYTWYMNAWKSINQK